MLMKNGKTVNCRRCGKCCLTNLIAYVTEADMQRWRYEKREDIFHIIEAQQGVWAGDRLVSAANGHSLYCCPFLKWDKNRYACSIYNTRPHVCREYGPGSSEICPLFHEKDCDNDGKT